MVSLLLNRVVIEDIELVIFDKDGTLIDLFNYWSNMVALRVDLAQKNFDFRDLDKKSIMYAMGVDTDEGKLRIEGPVGLKKREIVMQSMINALAEIGCMASFEQCTEIFKEADRLSLARFSRIIKPIDGLYKLIDSLHVSGCKIAIATTDKSERAKLAMKYLGIMDKIDVIVGDDLVDQCKPAPDMILFILDKLKINKNNAVMVGDAITDIEMGINAGLKASIRVCTGLNSKEIHSKMMPHVVDNISNIIVLNKDDMT